MIVVDASAIVDLLLNTPNGSGVAGAMAAENDAHVPELVEPEVLAALRRWLQRDWIAPDTADRAVQELGELRLVRHGHSPLRSRIWALRDRCSSYDACYVALAEALDAELVTTDERLGHAAAGLIGVTTIGGP
ncbi:MAG: type II toxin-antitoxin system VapC family toxin [Solirubrobacteraceae bacterium]